MTTAHRIVRLTVENVKRLRAVQIEPKGSVVQITGANGNGKTSVLDSIWWALAGSSGIQGQPIRRGATEALIRLDLGDIVVTRTFKAAADGEYTTSLQVKGADGSVFPTPQKMLNSLLDSLAFDPLAFARASKAERVAMLRRFIGFDFATHDEKRSRLYSARTERNREQAKARAAADAMPIPSCAAEPVDIAQLERMLANVVTHNDGIRKAQAERDAEDRQLAALRLEKVELERRLSAVIEEGKALRDRITLRDPLPSETDAQQILQQIHEGHAHNEKLAIRARREAILAEAEEAGRASAQLTAQIEAMDAAARDAVASAKLPVADLGLGEDDVTLAGVPFDQASDAEQLRASTALAMAGNPKLRIIRIRDGSLLDSASMRLLETMATERDFQVWIERVDDTGSVGIVIEDGSVVAVH